MFYPWFITHVEKHAHSSQLYIPMNSCKVNTIVIWTQAKKQDYKYLDDSQCCLPLDLKK